MKKIITAAILFALCGSAFAEEKSKNIGISLSLDSTIGIQGEFNIQQPVSVQVFYKSNSRNFYTPLSFDNRNYTALGAAGIYDLSLIAKIPDPRVHPYAGAGLYMVNSGSNSTGTAVSPPANSGIYLVVGAKYEYSPELNFDANINILSGITAGINVKF